jgi:hypothetical protein
VITVNPNFVQGRIIIPFLPLGTTDLLVARLATVKANDGLTIASGTITVVTACGT